MMKREKTADQQINALIGKGSKSRKKGKKGRKIGRYSKHPSSMRYRAEKRWETNRIRRVRRHLKRLPNDKQAREWFEMYGGTGAARFLASLPKQATQWQPKQFA